ncbi:uncharacterized protein [Nicotiana sylvestris]|uniref:uncharacterized protein n=1 Tax=Nicotiana sylvestris TaxID=4096 RepID=UPI00388CBCC7
MRGLGGQVSVAYKDLCLFPDVQLPAGFKMPKFDLYDRHGDPIAHLRGFCSKMRGAGGKDELLMAYFSQSLSGSVLEWYTRQDHGRWYTWDDLAQAFACHFQEQAASVDPPMKESEMVDYFLQALEPTYFSHLVSVVGKSFNEVVKMGGMVEEGLKSNKIMSYSSIKETTQAIQGGARGIIGKKKREDVATIDSGAWLRQLDMLRLIQSKLPNPLPKNLDYSIANKFFEVNRVTFSDEELPVEGTEHNTALYLMVKCEDSVVTLVLVDNGSSANICPLSTLSKLKVEDERNHKNSRPWIHAAKAVPSTLHQMVKFEWDRQEIVVHDKDNLCAHSNAVVPFIEMEYDKGPWVYQVFDTMLVEKVLEGKHIPNLKITAASVRVAFEMLKNGFVPSKGLGSSLQGIIQPVSLPKNFGTFGLGFKPTVADIKRARKLKQRAWVLPKSVSHLSRSFVKSGTRSRPVIAIPSYVIDPDKELIEKFEKLFDDVNMVKIREGFSNAEVQFVRPKTKLNNCKATPLPTRKEFCSFYAGSNDMVRMRNPQHSFKHQSDFEIIIQEVECDYESEYDEDEDEIREEIIKALIEYKDIFAWSYDDMPSLSTDLVVHKLPTNLAFSPVKQKLRKFKTDMSVKIKEEITKKLDAKVIRVTRYPIWLANVVPVPKKDDKIRVCVDYRNLNKASPKDNFPLQNIHILIDNCAKREIESFVDCYAGDH